jgi:hypothetical protein
MTWGNEGNAIGVGSVKVVLPVGRDGAGIVVAIVGVGIVVLDAVRPSIEYDNG